ncbi:MAG: hypothetical protein V1779_00635 [bacterium]
MYIRSLELRARKWGKRTARFRMDFDTMLDSYKCLKSNPLKYKAHQMRQFLCEKQSYLLVSDNGIPS